MRDVTITGMSVFTPRAATLEDFWTSLSTPHGTSAGRVHTVVDDLIVSSIAAADRRRCARSTQLALAGALAAIDDSGLDDATVATRDRRGVLLGTGFGASNELIEAAALLSERGPRFVSPVLAVLAIPEAAASAVANRLGYRGPCEIAGAACATGALTIGRAAFLIAAGLCDVIVAGAVEEVLPDVIRTSMDRLGVTSKAGTTRPFDARRDGFVASEGAAVVVLEATEHARARGARRYADVVGCGSCADAAALTSPEAEGTLRAMDLALGTFAGARVDPALVGYVNAHGSATASNDLAEARAVDELFSGVLDPPWLGGIKGATGHMLGAAGAVEVVASSLALYRSTVPPTVGCEVVADDVAMCRVAIAPETLEKPVVLSNSRGLGGHNVTVSLRACNND